MREKPDEHSWISDGGNDNSRKMFYSPLHESILNVEVVLYNSGINI